MDGSLEATHPCNPLENGVNASSLQGCPAVATLLQLQEFNFLLANQLLIIIGLVALAIWVRLNFVRASIRTKDPEHYTTCMKELLRQERVITKGLQCKEAHLQDINDNLKGKLQDVGVRMTRMEELLRREKPKKAALPSTSNSFFNRDSCSCQQCRMCHAATTRGAATRADHDHQRGAAPHAPRTPSTAATAAADTSTTVAAARQDSEPRPEDVVEVLSAASERLGALPRRRATSYERMMANTREAPPTPCNVRSPAPRRGDTDKLQRGFDSLQLRLVAEADCSNSASTGALVGAAAIRPAEA